MARQRGNEEQNGRFMVKLEQETRPAALEHAVRALQEKKGEDIRILDVRGRSSITDYLVIASGGSSPQLRALRNEVEKEFKENNISCHTEGKEGDSGWMVVDAFDVMVHIFHPVQRDHYQIEYLWRDAPEVAIEG